MAHALMGRKYLRVVKTFYGEASKSLKLNTSVQIYVLFQISVI